MAAWIQMKKKNKEDFEVARLAQKKLLISCLLNQKIEELNKILSDAPDTDFILKVRNIIAELKFAKTEEDIQKLIDKVEELRESFNEEGNRGGAGSNNVG